MGLEYAGSVSLGALCAQAFALFTQLGDDAKAQLASLTLPGGVVGTLPDGTPIVSLGTKGDIAWLDAQFPTYADIKTQLENMVDSLQAAIDAGITAPQVSAGAGLEAQVELLRQLAATFKAMAELGAADGIDVFTWSGAVDALGPAVSSTLATGAPSGGGPSDASNGLVLLTRVPATWTAMSSFFSGV